MLVNAVASGKDDAIIIAQECQWHVLTLYEIKAGVLCPFDRPIRVLSLPVAYEDP